MLSITPTEIRVNSSSLDIMQSCMRKADFLLNRQYIGESAPALKYGQAIHSALAYWYSLPVEQREWDASVREEAKVMAYNEAIKADKSPILMTVKAFIDSTDECIRMLPEDDKRSISNGVETILEYIKLYWNDGLEIVRDSGGVPLVEREVSFELGVLGDRKLVYFGTLDAVMINPHTGIKFVVDHKTTSALGKDFLNRIKPNHQYTGYWYGAKSCFGIDTDTFLINGIQVAKTKKSFTRQYTTRNNDDLEELIHTTVFYVLGYLRCLETGVWPISCPNPCAMWGGCKFLEVCSAPLSIRESVIKNIITKVEEN